VRWQKRRRNDIFLVGPSPLDAQTIVAALHFQLSYAALVENLEQLFNFVNSHLKFDEVFRGRRQYFAAMLRHKHGVFDPDPAQPIDISARLDGDCHSCLKPGLVLSRDPRRLVNFRALNRDRWNARTRDQAHDVLTRFLPPDPPLQLLHRP